MRAVLRTTGFVWRHPLNRGGRIAAMGRLLRWQIASRLMGGRVEIPFVGGTSLFARRGMTGATGNWYAGLHEAEDMAFCLHLLRAGDLFVDVGANVGSYTVLAAGACRAEVVAVEPSAETRAALRSNVALNGIEGRVEIHAVGLGAAEGEMRLSLGRGPMNRALADGDDAPSETVPIRTLDAILGGRAPALLKIDVEGGEADVLKGAAEALASPGLRAVIAEANDAGAVGRLLAEHGFVPASYDPHARRLGPPVPGANALFVRDDAALRARLAEAPPTRLGNGATI